MIPAASRPVTASASSVDPAAGTDSASELPRPLLRGWLHTVMFALAIPAGTLLIVAARGAAATTAAALYTASLLLGFGTSAAYHRLAKSPRARRVMQRLDHSMIYVLITGTYVPICIVVLPPEWGIPLLSAVGLGAIVGMVLKLTIFDRIEWLGHALYPVMGWAAVAVAPALARYCTPLQLGLVAGGGVAYTVGFPVLLVRRPDPWPRTFGYHEVWHGFTAIAAVMHFAVVAAVVS